jgi:hypothetical protein
MKLAFAALCVTCDEVYNEDEYKSCPSCTDSYPLNLLSILKPIKEVLPRSNPNDKKLSIITLTPNDIVV